MIGFEPALLITAFVFGLRHGIDWDHIAAITDITASQTTPKKAFYLATLYALGHAAILLILGFLAVKVGALLPESFEVVMEKVVGVTLLALGIFVFYSLIRHGSDFRMRSRWMLIFSAVRRTFLWITGHRKASGEIEHEHEHNISHDHEHADETSPTHRHSHRHASQIDSAPFMDYGITSALSIGAIHGIGAETPTQVLLFLAAGGVGSDGLGMILLGVFIIGLFSTNTLVALASSYGFLRASGNFKVYAVIAVITGGFSLVLGVFYVFGLGASIPELL